MSTDRSEHCMECGRALTYRKEGGLVTCTRCGRNDTSAIICPAGHYICDPCHSSEALSRLAVLAGETVVEAPEDILEELLALPNLPMHGPEHHAMAGLALLVASQKAGISLPENYIAETIRRCMQIPGGTCGYHGACGAAVSLGVAVSMATGATPLTGPARGIAHRATAAALLNCADDQARCCKRALRKTVAAGRSFFAKELQISFPPAQDMTRCKDIARNRECAGKHCSYVAIKST